MIWQDILLDRVVNNEEIVSALAQTFGVGPDDIVVVDDLSDVGGYDTQKIVCELLPTEGDFVLRISIVLRSKELEGFVARQADTDLVSEVCERLQCRCLMADTSINPYQFLLVEGGRHVAKVDIDAECLDNGKYILSSPGED